MNKPRCLLITGLILAATAARLGHLPANFSPLGAVALFGGATFADKRLAFGVPLAALLLSDCVLGFYNGMLVVYGSFALIVVIGFGLRARRRPAAIAAASVAAAVGFFATTNFGVWAAGVLYPRTLAGLGECYVAALLFFRNTLVSQLVFSAALFGAAALAESKFASLREPAAA